MATPSTTTATPTGSSRTVPRHVVHSAWAVPVLVVGQFAFLAVIPVTLIAVGTLRKVKNRTLRLLAGLLTATYAVPFLWWAANPDRAASLSKDMSPVFASLIVASSVIFVLQVIRSRRR
ncbi:MAG: hypothetical protein WBA97_32470 [Actinophytocola sp.]|uniref:hypothetical protein n=1 Tax=Actinophytocola sp. TaxID=1872138 RepID=UPI003C77424A